MKAVALLLCCVAFAAALSVKSSPEARFAEVDTEVDAEAGTGAKFAATVVSDRDYATLKHEEAEKAVAALHLPGAQPDMAVESQDEADMAGEANEEELLALAAATESSTAADEADVEEMEAVEQEVDAAEAEADAEDVALIEEADEDEEEDEAEDEAEEEAEEEADEEDMALLEVEEADEDEEEAEDESEDESEAEEEADEESEEEEEAEEEDAAFIEADASPYISPVLVPGKPNKYNDAMPDATYDKTAETNLFPPAKFLVGAGPKPKPYSKKEIAAVDAQIAKLRAKKGKKARKGKKSPKPAAKGKRSKRSKRSKKGLKRRGGRKGGKRVARKSRRGGRKASRRGRKHGRKHRKHARKSRRGGKKGRKHGRKGRKGSRKGRKAARKGKHARGSKLAKRCAKNPKDPRCIITPPYLQDIRDARHAHFVKGTNDLLNEVDDGLLEHMIYPKIADPNKSAKACKTKAGKKAKKF